MLPKFVAKLSLLFPSKVALQNVPCDFRDKASRASKKIEIEKWRENKGVLVMGYEIFMRLTTVKDESQITGEHHKLVEALVNPGINKCVVTCVLDL